MLLLLLVLQMVLVPFLQKLLLSFPLLFLFLPPFLLCFLAYILSCFYFSFPTSSLISTSATIYTLVPAQSSTLSTPLHIFSSYSAAALDFATNHTSGPALTPTFLSVLTTFPITVSHFCFASRPVISVIRNACSRMY